MNDAGLIGLGWRTAGERHREIAAEIARETRAYDAGAAGRVHPQPQPMGAWRSPSSGATYQPLTRMAKIAMAQQSAQTQPGPAPTSSALKSALDEFHRSHTEDAGRDGHTMSERLGETFNREMLLRRREREVREKDRLLELQQSEINLLNRRLASAVALPPSTQTRLDYTPVFPLTQPQPQPRSQALAQSLTTVGRGGYMGTPTSPARHPPPAVSPAPKNAGSSAQLQHSFLLSVKDSLESDSEKDELRLLDSLKRPHEKHKAGRRRRRGEAASEAYDAEQLLISALRMEIRRAAENPTQSWDGVLDLIDCVPDDVSSDSADARPERHRKHRSRRRR